MLKVDLSKYQNTEFRPGNLLKRMLWYIVSAILFESGILPISAPKRFILQLFGAKIGKGVVIKPHVQIKYPWFLIIGDHSWIGERVWIDNLAKVQIGQHVCLSQGAMLLTGNHDYTSPRFDLIIKPIEINDGAWIGAKAVVCPGVKVNTHAVLAVGGVATNDLDAFTLYSGNPAMAKRNRTIR